MEQLKIEYLPLSEIKPYKRNAKKHPREQVEQIKKSIQDFGMNDPIAVWKQNEIIEGHGRYIACKELGIDPVPVIRLDGLTDEQRRAYMLIHNKLTMNSDFDLELLNSELDTILDIDMDFFGFGEEEEKTPEQEEKEAKEEAHRRLSDFFVVPPFSVLDTRTGLWQERKEDWNVLIGNASETRDGDSQVTYDTPEYMPQINDSTSNFDPVLAEVAMKWFNRPGGKILDPFGGEQTKGVVAGELGYPYYAVEFRQEQVDVNKAKTASYPSVHYYCGDSNNIDEIIAERDFDMCFTSPPYYDLEVYSKEDMSALGTYEEFMTQYKNIFTRCYNMMKDGSFLVIKVGEIRDKKTGIYRSFVPDNINIMKDIGFHYYNELILVSRAGSAPMRAGIHMKARKVVKLHQNVLVFYKGNPEKMHEQVLVFYKGNPKEISSIFPQLLEENLLVMDAEGYEENGSV